MNAPVGAVRPAEARSALAPTSAPSRAPAASGGLLEAQGTRAKRGDRARPARRDERAQRAAAGGGRAERDPGALVGSGSSPAAPSGRAVAGAPGARPSLDTHRTSCSNEEIRGTSCTHPPVPPGGRKATDTPGAFAFREAVAARLDGVWQARANALRLCGAAGIRLACDDCGSPHLVPYRCGARTCPYCSWAGAARVVDRIAARVEAFNAAPEAAAWDGHGQRAARRGWKHVVVTTRAPLSDAERWDAERQRVAARDARAAWGRMWRALPWGRQKNDRHADGRRTKRSRRDTAYALGLEISPRGMVHIHALVHGEFIEQRELSRAWAEAVGERPAAARYVERWKELREDARGLVVYVSALRGDSAEQVRRALREVLKYATKGEKGARRAERAACVELALRNLRRVEYGGALRTIAAPAEGDDVTPDDLHAAGALSCAVCEARGRWTWDGLVSRDVVRENGGFGLLTLATVLPGQSMRALEARYYGGAPPWEDGAADQHSTENIELCGV